MSKKQSLWNFTSEVKKPWFHSPKADDKFTAVVMWVTGYATIALVIAAIAFGTWRLFWLGVVVAVFQWMIGESQDKDAPWMATEDDPFICPHCNTKFVRKDMHRAAR
jgi:hypothetical protein